MACRIGAAQAERDAQAQENPRIKSSFVDAATRYNDLAVRFENARSSRTR